MPKPAEGVATTRAKKSRTCRQGTEIWLQNFSQTATPFYPGPPSKKSPKQNNEPRAHNSSLGSSCLRWSPAKQDWAGAETDEDGWISLGGNRVGIKRGRWAECRSAGASPLPVLMVSVWLAFVRFICPPLLHPFSEREKISLIHIRSCESPSVSRTFWNLSLVNLVQMQCLIRQQYIRLTGWKSERILILCILTQLLLRIIES